MHRSAISISVLVRFLGFLSIENVRGVNNIGQYVFWLHIWIGERSIWNRGFTSKRVGRYLIRRRNALPGYKARRRLLWWRVVLLLLVILIVRYPVLIGWSLDAAKNYLEARLAGVSHELALCYVSQWSGNIARAIGIEELAARSASRLAWLAYCPSGVYAEDIAW